MNIRKWLSLFFSTLLIGGIADILIGAIVDWDLISGDGFLGFILGCVSLFGLGCLFSVLSQMGFFAYLSIHRFGLGMFRPASLWNGVQIVFIAFVYFDLVYFRYAAFANSNETFLGYLIMPTILLLFSLWIARIKAKETNRFAFVPTVFFMFAITTIEWYIVLKGNDISWLWKMIVPLLACNTWQVLRLHRLIAKKG